MTKKWRCIKNCDGQCELFWLGWLEYKITVRKMRINSNYLQLREDGLKRAEAEINHINRGI